MNEAALALERTRGLSYVCATCGAAETMVKDTRPAHYGGHDIVRRRRSCTHCNSRFSTIEIDVVALDQLVGRTAAAGALHDIENAVQRLAKALALNGRG